MTDRTGPPVDLNQVLDLRVGEVVHGGWCVARLADTGNFVVFVRHALPGERVRAVVTQLTSKFARADAVEITEPAPERVRPPCPYARPGGCGGCDWQHASLDAQREFKAAVIAQQLRRIAGIEREVTVQPLPAETDGLRWRTRVRFAVDGDGQAGFHKHRSTEIVPVGDCLIAHPLVTQAEVTRRSWSGERSVDVAVAPGSGERVVMTSHGGQQFLVQRAAGRDWRVAATGFWQVHPAAADTLAAAVLSGLAPKPGETALDLFCGAGLFAGVLADAVGPDGTVIGVEQDQAAVRDARHNLRPTPWARVHRGDAAEVMGRIGLSGASIAVLDPPRAGVGRELIDALRAAKPGTDGGLRRIAYVSCDPATLARDLAAFGRNGWHLAELTGFDAFPMTHHVECLALIEPAG
ncbi:MAG TPA: methyltransferase domain-containing protein [Streptosporangiaceae bacterium]|nr:methyltransferase domain-containing protein [Streptosporangiaceae bacterium]